jgi:rubrerythrin
MLKKTILRGAIFIIIVLVPISAFSDVLQEYRDTVNILKKFHDDKTFEYIMYSTYSQKAYSEGYPRLGYLFYALASSESINAGNFGRLLTDLGIQVKEGTKPKIKSSDTITNLRSAIEMELREIDKIYPVFIRKLNSEYNKEVKRSIKYAGEVDRQHLGLLHAGHSFIALMSSASMKKIEETSIKYFVCQICGSIVVELPRIICPICSSSVSYYKEAVKTEQYQE